MDMLVRYLAVLSPKHSHICFTPHILCKASAAYHKGMLCFQQPLQHRDCLLASLVQMVLHIFLKVALHIFLKVILCNFRPGCTVSQFCMLLYGFWPLCTAQQLLHAAPVCLFSSCSAFLPDVLQIVANTAYSAASCKFNADAWQPAVAIVHL